MPIYVGDDLVLKFTVLSSQFAEETLAKLGEHGFTVPANWLPANRSQWPGRGYLEKLYADLDIAFSD